MVFPIYRKYSNELSYFKIMDNDHFIELKRTGKRVEKHLFEAKIFPDHNFIQDMISMHNEHWMEASEEEYRRVEASIIT